MNKTGFVIRPEMASTKKAHIDTIHFRGKKWSASGENISIEITEDSIQDSSRWARSSYLTFTSDEALALGQALIKMVEKVKLIDEDDILTLSEFVVT